MRGTRKGMAGASRRRISDILCLLALFMAHSFFPSHFLRHMYHPNEDGGWVRYSDSRAQAAKNIRPGVTLFNDRSILTIIPTHLKRLVCAHCHSLSKDTQNQPKDHSKTQAIGRKMLEISCETCHSVYYCNQSCLEANGESHSVTCGVQKEIPEISKECRISEELLIALIHLFANGENTTIPLLSLLPSPPTFSPDFQKDINSAAEQILAGLNIPSGSKSIERLRSEKAAEWVAKVKYHTFKDESTGLITLHHPSLAAFQHSCSPNCLLYVRGTRVIVRSIATIAQNDSLTVSLIGIQELYSSARGRQRVLRVCRGIGKCDCPRCEDERKTGYEPPTSFRCLVEGCKGMVTIPLEDENTSEALREVISRVNLSKNGDSDEGLFNASEVRAGARCSQGHETYSTKKRIEKWIDTGLADMVKDLFNRLHGLRKCSPEATREVAKKILHRCTQTWGMSPTHRMMFTLYPSLSKACQEAYDYSQAAMSIQALIGCWQKVIPGGYWPPLSFLHRTLAMVLREQGNEAERRINSSMVVDDFRSRNEVALFRRLALDAETKARENDDICFG